MGSVFHAGDYATAVTSCTIFPIPTLKEELKELMKLKYGC